MYCKPVDESAKRPIHFHGSDAAIITLTAPWLETRPLPAEMLGGGGDGTRQDKTFQVLFGFFREGELSNQEQQQPKRKRRGYK